MYSEIQKAKSFGETFATVSALTLANKNILQNRKIEDYFFNSQEVYFLHYNKIATRNFNASMTLDVPLGSRNMSLELQEYKMEYQITTSDNQKISQNKNIRHYHGIVKNDPKSIASITFGEDEIIGLIATDEGNFNIAFDRQSG